MIMNYMYFFFFSSRRRHTCWPRDWSSDVCSSDLNGRLRQQEGARDLLGGQAADHPQCESRAGLARQQGMTGGEDQPKQLIADVVVERRVPIGHGLLLLLQVPRDHLVLVREHLAATQMIQCAALGGCHQPG